MIKFQESIIKCNGKQLMMLTRKYENAENKILLVDMKLSQFPKIPCREFTNQSNKFKEEFNNSTEINVQNLIQASNSI